MIPTGVAIPESVGEPDEPPHALYVGRLSEEKGVRELAEAADGLPLVVVGDGPLRALFPQAVGFVPPRELGAWYERAALVVVPSRREGYGMVAREAMAYGRPVVATAVGGLSTRSRTASPASSSRRVMSRRFARALDRLLGEHGLREKLGASAARQACERFSVGAAAEATLELLEAVARGRRYGGVRWFRR